MARGSTQAQTAAGSAQGISNTAGSNAGGLYSTLAPTLMAEATHPQGMGPTALAGMTTAAEQTGGGTQSGAVGQGALRAARTRNIGAGDAATAQSARQSGEQVSKGVLGVQMANEALKQRQQQAGLSGMEGLYGQNLGASVNALGEVAQNVNANTNAANESWDWAKYLLDPAMQSAATGAGLAVGCWIAEALYGADDPRTWAARRWLNGEFQHTWLGRLIMRFYLRFGERVAFVVSRSNLLQSALRPLFDLAVERGLR